MTAFRPRVRRTAVGTHAAPASAVKAPVAVVALLATSLAAQAPPGSTARVPDRLIDMHVHAWQSPPQTDAFKRSFLDAFTAFHLQRAVVSGPAAAAMAAAELAPGTLLVGVADGAGSILPSPAEFATSVQRGRIAVLGELDGAWDGEPLTATRLEEYLSEAESSGTPVAVFTGVAPPGTHKQFPNYRMQFGRPAVVEPILARHPRLRVYLMQAGWPFLAETIAFMYLHPGVYVDIGNLSANPAIPVDEFHAYLAALMRAGLGKRVMFGSGLDVTEWAGGIGAKVRAIEDAPFLSASERTDIFFANAERFLTPEGATFPQTPIVRADTVTFVAAGDASDPPRIVADFNGWQGGEMTPAADGRTYTLQVTLDPAARIEYLIAYKDRFVRDPGNPLTVPAPAGAPRSELRMPGYRPALALPPSPARGTIEEVPFVSRRGQSRRIRVYVPATSSRDGLPILYVHDGDVVIGALDLPRVLDALIGTGRMIPAVVAFVDAVDRHEDYAPGSPFRSVFTTEIVPMLERRYRVARDRRALLGLSRSTVGALDTCAHGAVAFDACALLAPAIPSTQFDAVLPPAGSQTRVLIETGTYDVPLVTDARALGRALEDRAVPVHYVESPEGHNHTAFRARLPDLMEELYRPRRAPPTAAPGHGRGRLRP